MKLSLLPLLLITASPILAGDEAQTSLPPRTDKQTLFLQGIGGDLNIRTVAGDGAVSDVSIPISGSPTSFNIDPGTPQIVVDYSFQLNWPNGSANCTTSEITNERNGITVNLTPGTQSAEITLVIEQGEPGFDGIPHYGANLKILQYSDTQFSTQSGEQTVPLNPTCVQANPSGKIGTGTTIED